ncbi:unnamed protein product [Caenorhabditis angaria]|uniref:Annexin n=1 Tax=Caenorhabditis angaria TaxID=860376 RepID=A0A9P1IGD8_9PELO|nr:unnamed protein product [Caenorhabditis angaria]
MHWICLLFFCVYTVSTKNVGTSDVRDLKSALEGTLNTTEVIRILCNRNNSEIQKIIDLYHSTFGQDLKEVLNEKLSDDDFKYFIIALLDTKPYYEAKLLFDAMNGFGTDEDVLIEILVSRTNKEINEIKKAYWNLYHKDFVKELKDDTEGDLEDFLVLIAAAERDESKHTNIEKAKKDANRLHEAGVASLFHTNEEVFNEILVKQNFDQLRLVFKEYRSHKIFVAAYHEIEVAIDEETSGYINQALKELIQVIRNKSNYFARLFKSGDRKRMIRTIVSRSEIDLKEIVEQFGGKNKLKTFVEKWTSGDLKNGLVTFLENHWYRFTIQGYSYNLGHFVNLTSIIASVISLEQFITFLIFAINSDNLSEYTDSSLGYSAYLALLSAISTVAAIGIVNSYKYVIFVPNISNSQVQFCSRVAETLVGGGHDVTMLFVSHFSDYNTSDVKIPKGVKSYNLNAFVEGASKAEIEKEQAKMIFQETSILDTRLMTMMKKFTNLLNEGCRKVLQDKKFLAWIKNENFDVAYAYVYSTCPQGIIHYAGIPSWVWLNSGPMLDHVASAIGVPTVPSYVPPVMMESTDEMTFFERTKSFIGHALSGVIVGLMAESNTAVFREELNDPNFPSTLEISQKCPLVIVNTNELYDLPRPLLAKVINIGGLGVGFDSAKPLKPEIQKIVDSGKGTIVFSFGSVAAAHEMPEAWKNSILEAFAEFPDYQFFMRYIADDLNDRLPKNVHISKWLPQKDLLLNPKTKAFITHGGYNSLQESISAGVPMITIALFGDQPKNAKLAKKHGFAVNIAKGTISKQTVSDAIREIINNPNYSKNAQRFSSMVRKQPFKANELLLRWSEFLAEFKTLDNLVPAGQKLNFFQYHSLDVMATLLLIVLIILFLIYKTLRFVICKVFCCFGKSQGKLKQN